MAVYLDFNTANAFTWFPDDFVTASSAGYYSEKDEEWKEQSEDNKFRPSCIIYFKYLDKTDKHL